MAYLNKVMLIGNLGKDPSIAVTSTGRKCVSFSLATSRRYRDNNGETKEQTYWHNIVGWGKVADTMEQLGVHKGMTLYVEGALTNRSWTDQTTDQKRYVTEVNLDSFQLLTPRNQNSDIYQNNSNSNSNSYSQATNEALRRQQQKKQQQDLNFEYNPEDEGLPF